MGANLAQTLIAAGEPLRVALRERSRAWTYGELANQVARVGGALAGLGVVPGDRVAVLMPDGLECAASILGAMWIGAIAVPLTELGRPNDLRALVVDAGAVVAIVHASLEPILDEVRREMKTLREVVAVGGARGMEQDFAALVSAAQPAAPADVKPDDGALLLYSAGSSTEHPRGVMTTHAAPIASQHAFGEQVMALGRQDRVFSAVKLATAYGFGASLVFPLAAGAEAILMADQPHSKPVFDLLRVMEPTVMFATASLYSQLLADIGPGERPLAKLRACVSGAETFPADLHVRVKTHLGADVLAGYGLTEAFNFVLATPPGGSRPGSSGKVIPGFEVRIVGDDGQPAPAQEIGTLEIRGPSVAQGYWQRPDDTKAAFRGEWLHTGDRFMVDDDGYYYHCGRADDLFKVGGKWVSPGEVEQALLRHEAVWECAVIGVNDENGLTKPLAFVVPNVGHAGSEELERSLIEYVKNEIAPYKYPRWIEFVDALPKGSHGKVLRYKLRPTPRKRNATVPPT